MTEKKNAKKGEMDIPKGQLMLDNLLWLFILSVLIGSVVYNAWGLFELQSVPAFIP